MSWLLHGRLPTDLLHHISLFTALRCKVCQCENSSTQPLCKQCQIHFLCLTTADPDAWCDVCWAHADCCPCRKCEMCQQVDEHDEWCAQCRMHEECCYCQEGFIN